MQYNGPAPKWHIMEMEAKKPRLAPRADVRGANVELQRTINELHKKLDEELEKLRKLRNKHLN